VQFENAPVAFTLTGRIRVSFAGHRTVTLAAPVEPEFSPQNDNTALPALVVAQIINALCGASAVCDAAAVRTIL